MKISIQNKIVVFLLALIVVASCKSKQNLNVNKDEKTRSSKNKVFISDIFTEETVFTTFQSKSRAQVQLKGKSHDLTLNLRIKKDEVIWASVTAFAGLEVARMLITPDTIKLMNRLEAEYSIHPFSFIHMYTSSKIDFKALQALLIGNSIQFTLESGTLVEQNNAIVLQGSEDGLSFVNTYSKELKPVNVQLKNSLGQHLTIKYTNYNTFAEKQLPINLTIVSKIDINNINLDIEYQNPQFDISQDYPFTIPKRFTQIK